MTTVRTARRTSPGVVIRTGVMLLAVAIVSGAGLLVVNVTTSRGAPANAGDGAHSSEEERPLAPNVAGGLGELAVQLVLVGGVAVAGRRFLRIRL